MTVEMALEWGGSSTSSNLGRSDVMLANRNPSKQSLSLTMWSAAETDQIGGFLDLR